MTLTKEARERLELMAADNAPVYVGIALRYISALEAERDALKARVAMFQTAGVAELGAHNPDVASYCSEWESRATKAEARVAVLAAECRASRHNDECANYCTAGVGPRHDEDEWADASTTLKAARAATDANGGLDG